MSVDRTFRIREARADDVPALAALHVATFKEAHGHRGAPTYELREAQWRAAFERDAHWFCYIAETAEGQPVGFARGELHDGGVPGFEGELNKIYVLRAWHRSGIGRALVERVARRFLEQGVGSMLLFGDARSPSNGFYQRLGAERLFSPTGEFHGAYGWRDLRRLVPDPRTPPDLESLSEATFHEVLARAADLDEHAASRVNAAHARAIALELGVSPGAWDAAMDEHERAQVIAPTREPRTSHFPRALIIAASGIGLGIASGMGERLDSLADTLSGFGSFGILIAVTLALVLANLRRGTQLRLQVDLAAWWWPFPLGFWIGFGRLFDDVFGISAFCWLLAALIGGIAMHVRSPDAGVRLTSDSPRA